MVDNNTLDKIREAVLDKMAEIDLVEAPIRQAIVKAYSLALDGQLKRILVGWQILKKKSVVLLLVSINDDVVVDMKLPLEKKEITEIVYERARDVVKNTFVTSKSEVDEINEEDTKVIEILFI